MTSSPEGLRVPGRRALLEPVHPLHQLALFAVIGGIATAVHFACLALLVETGAATPVPASCAGAIAGALVSYALNYAYTFRSRQRHGVAVPRFLLVAVLAFVVNGALLAFILAATRLHYLIAQGLTTLAVMLLTYAGGRWWVFR